MTEHDRPWSRRLGSFILTSLAASSIVIGLTACGPAANTSTTSSKPTPGGTIVFAQIPQVVYNWYIPVVDAAYVAYNENVFNQIYKPLLWINNNYSINWKSSVADRITYNQSGTVYHIYLNPKWHWSNGTHVTSKDLLFTWDVIKAASATNAPAPWPYVGAGTGDIPNGIKSVVANGNYEVTITLKQPANQQWFIYNGIIQLVPMPHVWDVKTNMSAELKYLGSHATNPKFVSIVDGPFKLGKVVPNQYWTLLPNKNYSGHKSIVKKIVFLYEASDVAEFEALKSGTASIGYLNPSQWGSRRALLNAGDTITPEYEFAFYDNALNMFPNSPVKKIFDNLYVREAMQMGLNAKAIDNYVYHGFAPPIDGPLPRDPMTKFYDSALNKDPYPYNIAKGKKLLETHGWHEVRGVMTKGSERMAFVMMYPAGTETSAQAAEIMQEDWHKEGIKITLKPEPIGTLLSIATPGSKTTWDMATGPVWAYDGPGWYPSGDNLFNTGASSGFGYSNANEDALIDATHKPYATAAENMKVFDQYELYTAKQLPVLWLNNPATLVVHLPDVHNSVKYADASPGYPQMQYWWVSSSN